MRTFYCGKSALAHVQLALIVLAGYIWTQTAFCKDQGFEDFTIKELVNWKAPEEFEKKFPYALSGFDDDGAPIWVAEFGKYDPIPIFEGSQEVQKQFRTYWLQMFARFLESASGNSENPGEFILICDMDGLDLGKVSSPLALELSLWIAREAERSIARSWKAIYIVNANYVFTTMWNLIRPIIGRNSYKVDVYGTNRQSWVPKLLRDIPKNQIPDWLGGSEDHKPVLIYG